MLKTIGHPDPNNCSNFFVKTLQSRQGNPDQGNNCLWLLVLVVGNILGEVFNTGSCSYVRGGASGITERG